jgi:hypothetical protein
MNYFSTDYFTARSKFIIATNPHHGRLKSYQIAAKIPLADDLTIDVTIFGNPPYKNNLSQLAIIKY